MRAPPCRKAAWERIERRHPLAARYYSVGLVGLNTWREIRKKGDLYRIVSFRPGRVRDGQWTASNALPSRAISKSRSAQYAFVPIIRERPVNKNPHGFWVCSWLLPTAQLSGPLFCQSVARCRMGPDRRIYRSIGRGRYPWLYAARHSIGMANRRVCGGEPRGSKPSPAKARGVS
jgi:hypothetical protein